MSVIASYLLAADTSLELDEFGRATVTKKFLVITNNGNGNLSLPYNGALISGPDNEYTVAIESIGASPDPVPQLLTQYNLDHAAGVITGTTDTCTWLTKKRVTRVLNDETDRNKWHIHCTWTPLPLGYAGGLGTGGGVPVLPNLSNPLADPVIERSEYEHYRKKVEYDINGSAIVNSAGDPLPLWIDDLRPVLVYIKNKATTAEIDTLAEAYKNATNSDVFRGRSANTLKIVSITKGQLQERAGTQFVPMIVRIHPTEKSIGSLGTDRTWDVELADRGAQIMETHNVGTGAATVTQKVWPKVQSGTARGEFLDLVNLNADGTRRDDGLPPLKKTFRVYQPMPFSGLGLT